MRNMSYLRLDNISYDIDQQRILKNISLDVEKGQIFSILGPSGTGKSTALKIITGALAQKSGDVILEDRLLNQVSISKRKIVMVHQAKLLFPHMTVEDNIGFGLRVNKYNEVYIGNKTKELLEFFGLMDHTHKYPHELSGGQQQLVALMRALAVDPKLLLLDEPFTGLDNSLKKYIRDFIIKVNKKYGTTIIMVTHDKEDAFFMSDRIAFMFDGEITICSSTKDLIKATGIERVDDFLGEIIVLDDGKIVFSDKIIKV
jgi:ABC-type Fe3+/spermidine/putrescine transport system ATPase subunit